MALSVRKAALYRPLYLNQSRSSEKPGLRKLDQVFFGLSFPGLDPALALAHTDYLPVESELAGKKCSAKRIAHINSLLQSLGTVMTANGRQTSEEESAAVNPLALKVLREKAGLSNLLIAATCATGHWYTVKHTVFQHDDQIEKAKSFRMLHSRLKRPIGSLL
ncbi:MAG: hypothetical protein M1821_002600 [Bathelium mastoideum]|nr:MAG: hypothetical protein M1821_002600 [Bathelium mastoideum]